MTRSFYLYTFLFFVFIFIVVYFAIYWLLLLAPVFIVFHIWKYRKHSFILLIVFIPLLQLVNYQTINQKTQHEAIVINVSRKSFVVEEEGENFFLISDKTKEIEIGDKISFKAKYKEVTEVSSFTMNINRWRTNTIGYANNIKIIEKSSSIRNKLFRYITKDNDLYSQYTKLMFYNRHDEANQQIGEKVSVLGINHLFVISGFHIALLFLLIDKILGKIVKNTFLKNFLSTWFSFFILWLLFIPLSGLRAWLFQTAINVNNDSFVPIENIHLLLLIALLFFIINPFTIFNIGVQLSFTITYFLVIYKKENSSKLVSNVNRAILAVSISFPFIASITNKYNILAIFNTLLLTPLISFSYILLIITLPFREVGSLIISFLDVVLSVFSNISFFTYIPEYPWYFLFAHLFFAHWYTTRHQDSIYFPPVLFLTTNLIAILALV